MCFYFEDLTILKFQIILIIAGILKNCLIYIIVRNGFIATFTENNEKVQEILLKI